MLIHCSFYLALPLYEVVLPHLELVASGGPEGSARQRDNSCPKGKGFVTLLQCVGSVADPHRAGSSSIKAERDPGTSEPGRPELESAQATAPAWNGEECRMVE